MAGGIYVPKNLLRYISAFPGTEEAVLRIQNFARTHAQSLYNFKTQAGEFEVERLAAMEAVSRAIQANRRSAGSTILRLVNMENQLHYIRAVQRSAGQTMYGFRLTVDNSEIFDQIQERGTSWNTLMRTRTLRSAADSMINAIPALLVGCINVMTAGLEEGAFPAAYKLALISAVERLPRATIQGQNPNFVYLGLPDIFKELGDIEDFEAGYHHGALKAGASTANKYSNNRVFIPPPFGNNIEGLRTKDAKKRYKYWKAMYEGTAFNLDVSYEPLGQGSKFRNDSTGQFTRGPQVKTTIYNGRLQGPFANKTGSYDSGKTNVLGQRSLPVEGSFPDTVGHRLQAWRSIGRAPMWLLLEYGQPKWAPTIPQRLARNERIEESLVGGFKLDAESLSRLKESGGPFAPGNFTGLFFSNAEALWTALVVREWSKATEQVGLTRTALTSKAPSNVFYGGGKVGPTNPNPGGAGPVEIIKPGVIKEILGE